MITAISVYLQWMEQLVTLVVPPKGMSWETAQEICDGFENTMLFEREEEMLNVFLDLIDDADVLSGWNSEGYDIPYTVNRVARVLSKDDTRRFCLWGQLPKKRTFERFGAENKHLILLAECIWTICNCIANTHTKNVTVIV
jgi:DNA polymerase elongation subunit (family B)